MEEDPLIPLVHVWNNAAFDDSSSSSASAWHAHATPARLAAARPDKENRRPERHDLDVDAEIEHIEAEILRLSSRLHHLRVSRGLDGPRDPAPKAQAQQRPRARGLSLGPLDVAPASAAANPNPENQPPPLAAPQRLKPAAKQQAPAAARGSRGLSLGPLDIAAANPTTKLPAARQQGPVPVPATRVLKPIKEPPVQRRRGVSLGPMEIQHGITGKPTPATARAKPFPSKLNAIREEGGQSSRQSAVPAKLWPSSNARQPQGGAAAAAAPSRAKARSSSMSPRSRRQSVARLTANTRPFGATKAADELTPKGGATNPISGASTCRRPSGSSKVRVVPSRYSLMPGASAGTQERRRKDSLPGSLPAAADSTQKQETRATATTTEPLDDDMSPESLDKVAELLPRIRTMPPPDETPRDSGCAKRAADLVGKRSFFTAAAGDGGSISSYQARVLEAEEPEEAALAEEALGNEEQCMVLSSPSS
ncbi:translation initiation factor IF-2-like [Lolium rigidum]|uniref:translation initiation factor IF-2-like n=1 Tax=Lolium rigidum TaxID=89674 RepID=UPI001F5E1F57|nr:translation initiation factor IF-2-like [Lolium rigidum]